MSHPHRNPSPNNHIPTTASVNVLINAQSFHVALPDIPNLSLGPSIYDYVRTFEDSTSSISSGSPPGSPAPDPIPAHHHITLSPPNNAQPPVTIIADHKNQAGSRTDSPHQFSISNMSHRDDSSISGKNLLSPSSESSQAASIVPSTAFVQGRTEFNSVNKTLFLKDTVQEAFVVCECNGSSTQSQSTNFKCYKPTSSQTGAYDDRNVDRTDESSNAEGPATGRGTNETTEDSSPPQNAPCDD